MEKFLENVGLFRWYAWIDFWEKNDFYGGWDVEFGEKRSPQFGQLQLILKHKLVVLGGIQRLFS